MRPFVIRALSICLVTALVAAFNNCSKAWTPQTAAGRRSENPLANNGGGHSGKVVYAFFTQTPVCSQQDAPEKVIEIENKQAKLAVNQCSPSGGQNIPLADLFRNPYDPYYLVHEDSIYVNQSVYQVTGPGRRVTVDSFCYNSARSLDFAVRYDSVYNNGWQVTTVGHLISDSGRLGSPNSQEMVGTRPDQAPTASVRSPFISFDGKYRLDYGVLTSPTRGPGLLTIETGEQIPVECYILYLKGAADGAN